MPIGSITEMLTSPGMLTILKTICFLTLIALGGYMMVYFHRRDWFMRTPISSPEKDLTERIEVIDRKWLGGRQYLSLIRCGRRKVLVGMSRDRMVRLMEIGEESKELPLD
jgi:flagellar biogenesis protein FliO